MSEPSTKNRHFLLICLLAFLASGCVGILIPITVPEKQSAVEAKHESVPYSYEEPDDVCFMLSFLDAEWEIIIDFENRRTLAVTNTNEMFSLQEKYIDIPKTALGDIIDRIGGLDLTLTVTADGYDNQPRHYTGCQILNLFEVIDASAPETKSLKNQLVCAIFEKFSSLDFSNEDFCYIINNSNTNITYIDYFPVSAALNECFSVCRYFE